MTRLFSCLLLFLLFLPAIKVTAQESLDTQLEFIRRLRAKGYNDLALEQIDKLKGERRALRTRCRWSAHEH